MKFRDKRGEKKEEVPVLETKLTPEQEKQQEIQDIINDSVRNQLLTPGESFWVRDVRYAVLGVDTGIVAIKPVQLGGESLKKLRKALREKGINPE